MVEQLFARNIETKNVHLDMDARCCRIKRCAECREKLNAVF
jgi:hypothetical protein